MSTPSMREVGALLANVAFNWAQRPGHVLTERDCAMLKKMQADWDEASRVVAPLVEGVGQPDSVHLAGAQDIGSASEWRPIDTAPTDGTHVLVCWPRCRVDENDELTGEVTGYMRAVSFMNGGSWVEPDYLDAIGAHFGDDEEYAAEPSDWMPLPAPPRAAHARTTGGAHE